MELALHRGEGATGPGHLFLKSFTILASFILPFALPMERRIPIRRPLPGAPAVASLKCLRLIFIVGLFVILLLLFGEKRKHYL